MWAAPGQSPAEVVLLKPRGGPNHDWPVGVVTEEVGGDGVQKLVSCARAHGWTPMLDVAQLLTCVWDPNACCAIESPSSAACLRFSLFFFFKFILA